MTRDLSALFAVPYPVVLIESWSAYSGWPCFRVYLASAADTDPTWDGIEHDDIASAFGAARTLAANHNDCPIIDMSKDRHG